MIALWSAVFVASLIGSYLREEFGRSTLRKLQGAVATPALHALRDRLDARRYNGASLVGLGGMQTRYSARPD